jgi:hypothetical protein
MIQSANPIKKKGNTMQAKYTVIDIFAVAPMPFTGNAGG